MIVLFTMKVNNKITIFSDIIHSLISHECLPNPLPHWQLILPSPSAYNMLRIRRRMHLFITSIEWVIIFTNPTATIALICTSTNTMNATLTYHPSPYRQTTTALLLPANVLVRISSSLPANVLVRISSSLPANVLVRISSRSHRITFQMIQYQR